MAAEIENSSVIFTDEAEAALKKQVLRYERRIRGRALEEAVRSRGLPAEVTGSDVQRASFAINRRALPDRERKQFIFHAGSGMIPETIHLREVQRHDINRRKSLLEKTALLYSWLGAVGILVGLVWAPAYHAVRILSADPAWRVGFLIAQASFAMLVVGVGFKVYISRVRYKRQAPDIQEK